MRINLFSAVSLLTVFSGNAFVHLEPTSLSASVPRVSSRTDVSAPSSSTTALNAALTLYGHPGTRSPLCNWGAHEVGLDIAMGDLSQNPHPFGQIPCLTDEEDVLVFESGAILLYFHELTKVDQSLSKAQAAAVQSWITWANASLDPICFLETPDGKVYDTGLKKPNKRIDAVDELLEKQQFLVGDETFSLADVAVASYFLYVLQFFPGTDLSRWPHVLRYLKDCASRPAYAKAFGERVQTFLLDQLDQEPKKKVFGMF